MRVAAQVSLDKFADEGVCVAVDSESRSILLCLHLRQVKGASLFDVNDIRQLLHIFTLVARNPNYISTMNFTFRSR
jgi:hypothetical protein